MDVAMAICLTMVLIVLLSRKLLTILLRPIMWLNDGKLILDVLGGGNKSEGILWSPKLGTLPET